jgi:hypothetical protein
VGVTGRRRKTMFILPDFYASSVESDANYRLLLRPPRPVCKRSTSSSILRRLKNMSIAALYGFTDEDMETAKDLAEAALDIRFELHDSIVRCGDYYLFKDQGIKFILQKNFDEDENEWIENFHDALVIMYLDADDDRRARLLDQTLKEKIKTIRMLRWEAY